jgi:hypothetical protein
MKGLMGYRVYITKTNGSTKALPNLFYDEQKAIGCIEFARTWSSVANAWYEVEQ